MPSLVTACMLTTTYGRLYDQALLAVPIVALFGRYAKTLGRIPRNAIWIYTAVNFALIIGAMRVSPFAFPVAPLTVGLFLHFASVESWRHAHSANAGLEAR